MSVHHFTATDIGGRELALSAFAGKLLIIVNTASACGFTPQYADLQRLQDDYEGQLVVLGFPCNLFGAQEKGSDNEIASFCDLTYSVRFPLFSRIDVNGKHAHPLFRYLTRAAPGLLSTSWIKWNFTKFLVDRAGKPIARYAPQTPPDALRPAIDRALAG